MTAQLLEMPADQYFAIDAVSNTALKTLRRSARLYEGRYITGEFPFQPSTPEQRRGTLIHAGVLEGGVGKSIVIIPPEVLNADGHRKGKPWTDWKAANGGTGRDVLATDTEQPEPKELLKQEEADELLRIIDRVLDNQHFGGWFGDRSKNEQTILWTHQPTGLACKSRLDVFGAYLGDEQIIVDVKSCKSSRPQDFANDCARFSYANQQAFYVQAARERIGYCPPFVFLAVEKQPPYAVRAYTLDERDVARAHEQNEETLDDLAIRMADGFWRDDGENEILTLSLPSWKQREQEWELAT